MDDNTLYYYLLMKRCVVYTTDRADKINQADFCRSVIEEIETKGSYTCIVSYTGIISRYEYIASIVKNYRFYNRIINIFKKDK